MIQRKQTLFLLLSIICMVITATTPIVKFYGGFSYTLKMFSFTPFIDSIPSPEGFAFNLPLALIGLAVIILNAITIFIYKKRKTQMMLVNIAMVLLLAFIALIFFYYPHIIEKKYLATAVFTKCIGIYTTLVSFIAMILANRGIKKDDELVKSLDRIR